MSSEFTIPGKGLWEGYENAERLKVAEQLCIRNSESLAPGSQNPETGSIGEVPIPRINPSPSEARQRHKRPLWVIALDVLREWH